MPKINAFAIYMICLGLVFFIRVLAACYPPAAYVAFWPVHVSMLGKVGDWFSVVWPILLFAPSISIAWQFSFPPAPKFAAASHSLFLTFAALIAVFFLSIGTIGSLSFEFFLFAAYGAPVLFLCSLGTAIEVFWRGMSEHWFTATLNVLTAVSYWAFVPSILG